MNDFAPLTQSPFRQPFYAISLVLISAVAVYAHVQFARAPLDFHGPLALLDRLFDLLLAAAIIALTFCIGRAIARMLKLEFAGRAEEIAYSVMLGTGGLALSVFCLGIAGWLRPWPVAMLVLLLFGITYREVSGILRLLNELFHELIASRPRFVAVSLIGLVSLFLLLRAATPPYSPDEVIYHLPVAQAFVERGRIFPLLDNFSGNLPFLVQMLYCICLMAKTDIAAKLLSLALGLVGALGLYGLCARFLSRRIGMLALFGFFAAGMVVEIAVTSRVDVTRGSSTRESSPRWNEYWRDMPGAGRNVIRSGSGNI